MKPPLPNPYERKAPVTNRRSERIEDIVMCGETKGDSPFWPAFLLSTAIGSIVVFLASTISNPSSVDQFLSGFSNSAEINERPADWKIISNAKEIAEFEAKFDVDDSKAAAKPKKPKRKTIYIRSTLKFAENETQDALIKWKLSKDDDRKEWKKAKLQKR